MAESVGIVGMIPADEIERDGIVWRLSQRGREILAPEMLDRSVVLATAETIKQGPHRAVYRVQINGLELYWKHAKFYGPRGWLRDLIRGPKSGIEYRRLDQLIARQIPTVQPLAWGRFKGKWPRGSFLITEALPDAITLGDYLISQAFSTSERREIARKLATFLAQLHAAGIAHTDMHPGNILLEKSQPHADWRLIDVHDLHVQSRPLSSRNRIRNLVMLNRWFGLRVSRTDRCAFWLKYQAISNQPKENAIQIEQATLDSNRDLWRSRDWRCLGDNREFKKYRFNGERGHLRKEIPDAIASAMAEPDQLLACPETRILKDSRTSTVGVVRIGDLRYILKRFNIKRRFTPLANLIRYSPAYRSWIGACAMENRGLPTPKVLALSHRHHWGIPWEGYLLTEFLPDAITIDEAGVEEGDRWLDETAMMVRCLHERGLAHRDLKASNIMVSGGKLYLIDLVGLERRRIVKRDIRARDLARLNVSSLQMPWVRKTDRLRWLKRYLSGSKAGLADWKLWWKEVAARSLAKLGKNQRSGRPIN